MDFLKKGEELLESQQGRDFLEKEGAQFFGSGGSDSKTKDVAQDASTDDKSTTQQGGKYDKYVQQGVQYTEKTVFKMDTSNLSDSQKATEAKVTGFISKQVDGYMNRRDD